MVTGACSVVDCFVCGRKNTGGSDSLSIPDLSLVKTDWEKRKVWQTRKGGFLIELHFK